MTSEHNTKVFLSYASVDRSKIGAVAEGLRHLGKQVWMDEALTGGQQWWDAILAQLRACDLFVQSVSAAALDSEACTSERNYALALGKPVIPVLVEPIAPALLPSDLAVLQCVEYSEATAEAAFRLAGALAASPPAPAPPEELPPAPDVPVSYLGSLSERVRVPGLSLDEQLALVAVSARQSSRTSTAQPQSSSCGGCKIVMIFTPLPPGRLTASLLPNASSPSEGLSHGLRAGSATRAR